MSAPPSQDIADRRRRRQRLRSAHLEELISHFERTAMEGLDMVGSSARALDGTARQLTGIIDRTNEQAASGAGVVARNARHVTGGARDTESAARHVLTAAADLSGQTERLRSSIEQLLDGIRTG